MITKEVSPANLLRQERNTQLQVEYLSLKEELAEAERLGSRVAIRRAQAALEDNRAAFVEANRGLALIVAKRFMRTGSRNADDYAQDAMVGLLEARERWDPERATFGTFSRTYIEGRVRQGVRKTEYGHFTKAEFDARPQIILAAQHLEESLGRPATTQEIAAEIGVTEGVVERVRRPSAVALDAPFHDGEGRLGDTIADVPTGIDSEAEEYDRWEFITKVAALLSARELFVISRHLGLDGAPAQTLAELGVVSGFGREPVRKTERRARAKCQAAGLLLPEAVD